MNMKKAVILIAVFLFALPWVFGVCSNQGEIDTDEQICVYASPTATSADLKPVALSKGYIYQVYKGTDNAYEVVSDGTDWYACDAENNGFVGKNIDVGGNTVHGIGDAQKITINVANAPQNKYKDYVCYRDGEVERIAVCNSFVSNTNFGKKLDIGGKIYPSDGVYCTVYGSAPNAQYEIFADLDDTTIPLHARQTACNNANNAYGGIAWTGTRCCGEDSAREYYNDRVLDPGEWYGTTQGGGCWNDLKVTTNTLVNSSNLAPNENFVADSNDPTLPKYWSRIGAPTESYLTPLGKYKLGVIASDWNSGSEFGIKSIPIKVRPNTGYKVGIKVSIPSISGDFYSLRVKCGSAEHLLGKISNQVTDLEISATFTTGNQELCELSPLFKKPSTGTVYLSEPHFHEDNPYLLNYLGQFYACGKTDFGTANTAIDFSANYMCSYYGNYFCSGDRWVRYDGGDVSTSTIIPGANLLVNPKFS